MKLSWQLCCQIKGYFHIYSVLTIICLCILENLKKQLVKSSLLLLQFSRVQPLQKIQIQSALHLWHLKLNWLPFWKLQQHMRHAAWGRQLQGNS